VVTPVMVGFGGVTVTVAKSDFVLSAIKVAVTVTSVFAVTVGAVNSPVAVTVPELAVHVTVVFEALDTTAVNC